MPYKRARKVRLRADQSRGLSMVEMEESAQAVAPVDRMKRLVSSARW